MRGHDSLTRGHLLACLLLVICGWPGGTQMLPLVKVTTAGHLLPMTSPPPGVPFSQVLLIAWDGAQLNHAVELMERGELPNLARLSREGGFAPTWITTHCTGTLAGFAEILSGYPPAITGAYGLLNCTPIPRDLTVFYRLKQHFGGDITTMFVASKSRRLGSQNGWPYAEARQDIDVWYGNKGAPTHEETGPRIVDYLRTHVKPGTRYFAFCQFLEPDHAGHKYGENSLEYEASMKDVDNWLGVIRRTLSEIGVASTTALFVVTDHGFDEGAGTHVKAPDAWLASNWTHLCEGDQKDVAPTLLAAYGVDTNQYTPPLPGRPLWDPARTTRPRLRWSRYEGFEEDGVNPDEGILGQTLHGFKVRVWDADGDEPEFVRLLIRRNKQLWRTYTLAYHSRLPTTAGRLYAIRLNKPLWASNYSYAFRARDDEGAAKGPATKWQQGPGHLPQLRFHSAPGFEDGLDPNAGLADNTAFAFRIIYQDNDRDPARYVLVHLWRDGVFYRSLGMIAGTRSPDPKTGVVYRCQRRLPLGNYEYCFEAVNQHAQVMRPANKRLPGPSVTDGVSSTTLTSLTAAPVAGGVQVTFSLAAPAQVEARILNIAGRPVKALCRAMDGRAGANTLLWNGQGDNGLGVANGQYVVEVTTRAPDGTQARALTPVTVRR